MKTTRRTLLKGLCGAALASAATPMFPLSCTKPEPCGKDPNSRDTVVIINGSFVLVFDRSKKQITAIVPKVLESSHHICRIDSTTIGDTEKTRRVNLVVTSNPENQVRTLKSYDCDDKLFRLDKENFAFDDTAAALAKITLPYPDMIYPHRMIGAVLLGPKPLKFSMSGALAFHYPSGAQPSVPEIPCYSPCSYMNRYVVHFSAESVNPNSSDIKHAQDTWNGLATNFKAMDWHLLWPLDRTENSEGPASITDEYIEGKYKPPALEQAMATLQSNSEIRGYLDHMARAANCKSPLFVTELP